MRGIEDEDALIIGIELHVRMALRFFDRVY